jgi:hypothetical protein
VGIPLTVEFRPQLVVPLLRWNSGYHEAFSHELFSFFHDGILAITKPFHKVEFTKCTIWEKTLYIYITKSIYIGPASLKTLPLDLEPPLQGKEYSPPYSKVIVKKKANVFFSEITYIFMIRPFDFLECKLTKKRKIL